MKNRDIYWRRYKIQETLYRRQWCLSPLKSRQLGNSHSSPNCHQLPHCIFLNHTEGLKSLPFKGDFNFRKSPKKLTMHKIWAESPRWFDVLQKNSAWDRIHDRVCCCDEAATHQFPIAMAFWIIWIVSTEECSCLTQNLIQICCFTQSFWMWQPPSTHAHSTVSTAPTD